MSTKTVKNSTVTPPTNAGTTIPGTTAPIGNPATAQNNGSVPPSLFEIIAGMRSSSKLDQAAMDYIDQIDRIFRDAHESITSIPIGTDNIEARAYIHDATRHAVILLFAESHQSLDMTPPSTRVAEVANALQARDQSVNVIQSIVVSKEDYPLAGNMAAFLSNCFKTCGGGAANNVSVDNLKGMKISAITNIDMVRSYVRKVSPHSIPARDDIGVLLCLEMVTQNPTTGQKEINQKPFMAITGYTRIMNPQDAATGIKFVPIPTITDVVTEIPNPSLLAMALPLAADAFIVQNLWTRPYATFRAGQPNLGNLITDPATKKPLFTDTAESFHAFIHTYMTNAFLAIDITEGRARPLGIETLIFNRAAAINTIYKFLHIQTPPTSRELQEMMMFANFNGTYVDKGVIKDTRCVDYLELAAKVTNHKEIEHLLLQPNQPNVRIEAIRGIFPEATKSLYTTTTIILDSYLVDVMSCGLSNAHIQIGYDMPASGNYNFSSMLTSDRNKFNGLSGIAQGFGRQGYNPNINGNIYASLF